MQGSDVDLGQGYGAWLRCHRRTRGLTWNLLFTGPHKWALHAHVAGHQDVVIYNSAGRFRGEAAYIDDYEGGTSKATLSAVTRV